MNIDNIMIEESDIEKAQDLCGTISGGKRNRAVANVLAANVAKNILGDDIDVDTASGLHNIPLVLEDIDISDIYINGSYIDVRFYFENSNICVPKAAFDAHILPVAYMFVNISSDLSSAKLSGFILPQNIDVNNETEGYYNLNEDDLVSYYDIESYIIRVDDKYDIDDEELYDYVDNTTLDKSNLYRKLLCSASGREKLAKICKANSIFNFVSINTETLKSQQDDNSFDDLINSTEDMYTNVGELDNEMSSNMEFTTVTTPSITEEDLEDSSEESNENISENSENSEQIEQLFDKEQDNNDYINTEDVEDTENTEEDTDNSIKDSKANKRKASPLIFLLLILIIGAGGYYGYNIYSQSNTNENLPDNTVSENSTVAQKPDNTAELADDAMPIETVEKSEKINNKDEAAANVAIPAIENNLDASILVSNLKVDWEVPSGYASNTSAKRYLVKLGKIIQLNLKTELLLLNKPPISNRITVEIKFNNSSKKFETVGIITSSGEKSIDDVIKQTVDKALNMKISVNTDSFDKLQGNPVLIIKL